MPTANRKVGFILVAAVLAFVLVATAGQGRKTSQYKEAGSIALVNETVEPTVNPLSPGTGWWFLGFTGEDVRINGVDYKIGRFLSLIDLKTVIRARCMNPTWPDPEVGEGFGMNDHWVLTTPNNSRVQHFMFLEEE